MSDGPPRIFDRKALALHRARAARLAGEPILLREAAEGLRERLAAVNRRFAQAMSLDTSKLALGILEGVAEHWTPATLGETESLPLKHEKFDLLTSVLTLQSVNDLPGVLAQIRRALKPDGLFVAALFGGATLFELRESFAVGEIETSGGVSPRVTPFADVRDLGGLLQRAGFALPVADVERTTVLYRDFFTLARDLRQLGETNALAERRRIPLTRATLAAMLAHYGAQHGEADGRLRATFEVVYLTGWAPHDSQQKPLAPGSAHARLADALGTTEKSAGEAAPRRQR